MGRNNEEKLSLRAKWLILKFIGALFLGSWPVISYSAYHYVNSIEEIAITKAELTANKILNEKIKIISDATEKAIESKTNAKIAASQAKSILREFEILKEKKGQMQLALNTITKGSEKNGVAS
jgi:hypothetical protein